MKQSPQKAKWVTIQSSMEVAELVYILLNGFHFWPQQHKSDQGVCRLLNYDRCSGVWRYLFHDERLLPVTNTMITSIHYDYILNWMETRMEFSWWSVCLPCIEFWVWTPALCILDTVTHIYLHSSQKAEAGRSGVRRHTRVDSRFAASLGYISLSGDLSIYYFNQVP